MKVLFSSDLHLRKDLAERVVEVALEEGVEVILNTGDFLSSDFANYFAGLIHDNGMRGYFVEGNWDNNLDIRFDSVKVLRYTYEKYKRFYFFGVYEKILLSHEDLLEITKHIPSSNLIFLTHEPPYGILDVIWNGRNIGNEIYLKFDLVKKPKIHAFGHVHEGNGFIRRDNTLFINAAMNDMPFCYVVDLKSEEVKRIKVKK